jgi:hypothetical protein
MPKNSKHVPPTSKLEVGSGLSALPSGPKPQHVKQPESNQLAPSEQSDDRCSTLVASKPRSITRPARRNERYEARRGDGAAPHPKWKRPNALKLGFYAGAPVIPGEDPEKFNQLYDELIDEWKSSGPTPRDAVFELAG